jgi:hypothetical protein
MDDHPVKRAVARLVEPALDVVLQTHAAVRKANRNKPTKPPYKSVRYPQLSLLFRPTCVFGTFWPPNSKFSIDPFELRPVEMRPAGRKLLI